MKYELPDGTRIEIIASDAYSGPAVEYGQRCGSAEWYRINGGEWIKSQHRTRWRLVEWISLSENLADFLEGEGLL
jgi:hypothetical protein